MTVAIVTDSAAAIPAELAARHHVSVVMWIHLGDATIAEGDRPLGEFLGDERHHVGAAPATTSGPSPASTTAPTRSSSSRSRRR
jgi:fatty acid-binding protein DegV